MPLRDHFADPLEHRYPWTSLLSGWAAYLAARLNRRWMPEEFVAHNAVHISLENETPLMNFGAATVVRSPQADLVERPPDWVVPPPQHVTQRIKGDYVEVRFHDRDQCWSVAPAVVSLVAPTNKETLQQRRGYLSRCLDIVTRYPHCLYNDLLDLLGAETVPRLPAETRLFAASFRPVSRGDRNRTIDPDERQELDIWVAPVRVGDPLPTMPLRLIYDEFVPVEFEVVYLEVLDTLRIPDYES